MKNIRYKSIAAYVIAFLSLVAAFTAGCGGGGGGGGDGRQVLPGENPLGPTWTNTGTGTGTWTNTNTNTGTWTWTNTNTNTGTWTNTNTNTNTGTNTNVARTLEQASSNLINGNTGQAITGYTQVINNRGATTEQKVDAYTGRGWAKGIQNSVIDSLSDFAQGMQRITPSDNSVTDNECRLGYALALIQSVVAYRSSNDNDKLNTAINILEQLLIYENTWYGTVIRNEYRNVYVSAPGARAMLALAYDLYGNTDKADEHMALAWGAAPSDINVQRARDTLYLLRGS